MTVTATRQPRFLDMTAEHLRDAYWEHRNAGARWANMANIPQGPRNRSRIARSVLFHQDRVELICAVARKRGIDVLAGS